MVCFFFPLSFFLLKLEKRQGCPRSPVLFNMMLKALLANTMKPKEVISNIRSGKQYVNQWLFTNDM